MNSNYRLPLSFGMHNEPEWVDESLVSVCKSYRDAVRLCWEGRRIRNMTRASLCEQAGLTPQHVSDYLSNDDTQGRRSLPADKVDAFERVCGNRAITQWEMKQRGLTIMEEVIARRAA